MPATNNDAKSDDPSAARAAALLRDMHKVIRHDLPNQMVALQSLLQLLSQEELARLSPDGQEYVGRLQHAARRASDLVRFLKEMERVVHYPARFEPIGLAALARELQGEVQRLHPQQEFTFEWQWDVPTMVGDARVLLQAIPELCGGLLSPRTQRCAVLARSQSADHGTRLLFHLVQSGAALVRGTPIAKPWAERPEFILARAWLALSGADVEVTLENPEESSFVIVVPNR